MCISFDGGYMYDMDRIPGIAQKAPKIKVSAQQHDDANYGQLSQFACVSSSLYRIYIHISRHGFMFHDAHSLLLYVGDWDASL